MPNDLLRLREMVGGNAMTAEFPFEPLDVLIQIAEASAATEPQCRNFEGGSTYNCYAVKPLPTYFDMPCIACLLDLLKIWTVA